MTLVTSVYVRVLASLDHVLAYFVGYDATYVNAHPCDAFAETAQINVSLTPCGESFVRNFFLLWQLLEELLHPFQTAMLALGGLFAVN